jgi:uncharacterized membrane protein YdbT with pleckstrin-like domain
MDSLVRFLKVPPEPEPPAGAHASVRTFRAARPFYAYRLVSWGLKQISAAVGLVFGFWFVGMIPDFPGRFVLDLAEYLGVATYLATLGATFLLVKLDYELRWYIVTDRSLRIREGIVHVREQTISFANIQNVSIRQGPLQRLFGIADVEVRTAGGGGGSSDGGHGESGGRNMHLGYFRGVDNAEEIRDAVLARVRELRDSGLGDPDAHEPDALAAAHELLDEIRAARAAAARKRIGATDATENTDVTDRSVSSV